jgi:electron transfer flavoprotein alpha subunit
VTPARSWAKVHLLVAGSNVAAVAEQAARIAGVGKVHVADDAAYDHQLAENVAPLIVQLMGHHDAFVAPATTTGKNVAPRVAALLDVMQISDVLSVEGPDTFTRPIYAGNAIATIKTSDPKLVLTVRGTAFEKAAAEGGSGTVEAVGRRATRACRASSGPRSRRASGPSLPAPRSSSRAGGRLARPSSSTR